MAVKLLERCRVAPPQGSVSPSTVTLTFYDLIWCVFPITTDRLFLYRVPHCSTTTFLDSHLPNLKHSLSLALERFHLLAGVLVTTDQTDTIPSLRYSEGDSVTVTVVECDDNFDELVSDQPTDTARLCSLVPTLPILDTDQPVLAIQVTVFPDQGIGIGMTVLHAAMDDSSSTHFMRTWASICKLEGDANIAEDLPFYDRSVIPELVGVQEILLPVIKQRKSVMHSKLPSVQSRSSKVRATFSLSTSQIDELRKWVALKASSTERFSTFTLVVALAWTCFCKTGCHPPKDKEIEGLSFPANGRQRLDQSVPLSYFGNFVYGCFVTVDRNSLVGDEGVVVAALAIRKGIRESSLKTDVAECIQEMSMAHNLGSLSLAGSPRFGVYKVDFGWGRPSKYEIMSIYDTGVLSIVENRDETVGGIEIGLAFSSLPLMEEFSNHFSNALKMCIC